MSASVVVLQLRLLSRDHHYDIGIYRKSRRKASLDRTSTAPIGRPRITGFAARTRLSRTLESSYGCVASLLTRTPTRSTCTREADRAASDQSICATASPESNRTNRTQNEHPMGTTTQHPPRSRLPQRIMRYPPNANRPRFRTRVKPTLSTMLSTIQKRHPLPKDGRFPNRHLLFEDHIFHDGLQVGQRLALAVGVGVLQRPI
jgi:hypothetical protein